MTSHKALTAAPEELTLDILESWARKRPRFAYAGIPVSASSCPVAYYYACTGWQGALLDEVNTTLYTEHTTARFHTPEDISRLIQIIDTTHKPRLNMQDLLDLIALTREKLSHDDNEP